MKELFFLFSVVLVGYFGLVFLVKIVTMKPLKECREKIAAFINNDDYELSADINYMTEVNKIVCDILGETRYKQLCTLSEYSLCLLFQDKHSGAPYVAITVNPANDNEKLQLETILHEKTKLYLKNYKTEFMQTYVYWDNNLVLGYPQLIIMYARNQEELNFLQNKKELEACNILAASTDVIDETEDLL